MEKVELHNAYMWDCPNCGRENFCRAVVAELTPEDVELMMREHGGEPSDWQTGLWMTRPDEVTCSACGAEFAVENEGFLPKPRPDGDAR